jgi:hypothetical protein
VKHVLPVATILSSVLLIGCARAPVAGEVFGRSFTPPRIEYDTRWAFGHRGALYGVDVPYTVPASFDLRLWSWPFNEEKGMYEPHPRRVDVAPEVFHAAVPGDWYSYEPQAAQFAATARLSRSLFGYPLWARKPVPREVALDVLAQRHRRALPEPP